MATVKAVRRPVTTTVVVEQDCLRAVKGKKMICVETVSGQDTLWVSVSGPNGERLKGAQIPFGTVEKALNKMLDRYFAEPR